VLQVLERRRVREGILLENGRRLGDVWDDWQRQDFEALDSPRAPDAREAN